MSNIFDPSQSMDDGVNTDYLAGHAAGLEEGLEAGLEAGLQEGTLVALRAAVLHVVSNRFGPPSDAVRLRVASESHCPTLYGWMDKVLEATEVSEIQQLLNQ